LGQVSFLSFRESFTIHGLWPSARTDKLYADFNVNNILDEDLYDDMINFWPPQSSSNKEFT
jgi:ribonuclease I